MHPVQYNTNSRVVWKPPATGGDDKDLQEDRWNTGAYAGFYHLLLVRTSTMCPWRSGQTIEISAFLRWQSYNRGSCKCSSSASAKQSPNALCSYCSLPAVWMARVSLITVGRLVQSCCYAEWQSFCCAIFDAHHSAPQVKWRLRHLGPIRTGQTSCIVVMSRWPDFDWTTVEVRHSTP